MIASPPEQQPVRRRVAVWNTFMDNGHPQYLRVDTLTDTLRTQGDFDVVALLEVQKNEHGHTGEKIAQALTETPGIWYPHSRKKRGEHIGMFGAGVSSEEDAKKIDIGYNKLAVVARLGDVAIAGVHLRRQFPPAREQAEQIAKLLAELENEKKAIIMGDFNSLRLFNFLKTRRQVEAAGYESAFTQLDKPRVRSFPTDEFSKIHTLPQKIGLACLGGAINLDEIYTKGVTVVNTGSFEGGSDHRGVWVEYEAA